MKKYDMIKTLLAIMDENIMLESLKVSEDNYTVNMNNGQTYKVTFHQDEKSATIDLLREDEVIVGRIYDQFILDYTKEEIKSNFKIYDGMLIETRQDSLEKGTKVGSVKKERETEEKTDVKMYEIGNVTLDNLATAKTINVKLKNK